MKKRIFISHSSKDSQTATIICNALESNGMKCWIAPRDIPYGKEWAGEISKAIENSLAFLFLSSGDSNMSAHVSREIQLALDNQIPIIPIKLDNCDFSDTNRYYLATIHCMFEYDASKIAKLVSDIKNTLPQSKETEEEQTENTVSSEQKTKQPRYPLLLTLCTVWLWLCIALSAYFYFFSGFGSAISIGTAFAAALVGFFPLFPIRRNAIRSFSINRKTVNMIFALAIAGAIGLAASGVVLDNYLWYADMENKYHIVLSAPEDMTATEFKTASETVKKRMDILADSQKYTIDNNGDTVELIVPFEIFGELTANDILKCYISRAARLYLTTNTAFGSSIPDPQVIEVLPENIASVQILKGKIPGEPAINEKNVIDKENYEYIEVVLEKDFYNANKATIDMYGDDIVFAQDKVEIPNFYYYFDTYKGEQSRVFYIVNNDRHPTLNELLVNNMTTPHTASSLTVLVDIAADWEKAEEGTAFGANQKNSNAIKGETVSVCFRENIYSTITDGQQLDTVANLKKRLDAFGEPYAFGYGINDPTLIVVKMSPEKLNLAILSVLCADGIRLCAGYNDAMIPSGYNDDITYVELTETDGVPAIRINASDEDSKAKFEQLFKAAQLAKKDDIYIVDSTMKMPLLQTKALSGDSLVFTCLDGEEQKNSWLPDFVFAVHEYDLPVSISLESYTFSNEDSEFENIFLRAETCKTIKDSYPVRFIEEIGTGLRIALDLPVDENLPKNIVSASKHIYETIDFDNSSFNSVTIYCIAEQGSERARVIFVKEYETIYSYDALSAGYPYVHGIFTGGRIQQYRQNFLDLIEKDEFFLALKHSAEGNLFFDY